ncbi:MAG: hypothetical protein E7561_02605 [Ruminococcaceae bacterium]|nr:hypothetical protein [Oscillospiraceae bacterium]
MQKKYITIVFDDGPCVPMREIIDKFINYDFKCGFAIVGNQIKNDRLELLKYAIDNGFELVSHSHTHVDLRKLTKKEIIDELMSPINTVRELFGYEIKLARLPGLLIDDYVAEVVKDLNLPLLGSGLKSGGDCYDTTTAETISESMINSVYDGAVGCMHVKPNTAIALDTILPAFKEMGYEIVTPDELFRIKGIKELPLGVNIKNCDL